MSTYPALGVTPNDEFGMRVFDAVFGAAAFGWRLAGPLVGANGASPYRPSDVL